MSFIARPQPPVPAPVLLKFEPAQVQISTPPVPDFRVDLPAEPIASPTPNPLAGAPAPSGPSTQSGGPLTLTVIHYVAPTYPPRAARTGKHGEIAMALLVNPRGGVDEVKVLRGTGSSLLDDAAVRAVRQWRFEPIQSVRAEPVWGQVDLLFAPPQQRLGVPLIVMPYAAVAREIDAQIALGRVGSPGGPASEAALRRLLGKLLTAFPPGDASSQKPADASLEAELALRGAIQSVRYLGVIAHGIDHDRSDASDPEGGRSRWEVYDVRQNRGSSVWLVAASASGSIERIEVAVR